jgi:hypothetical protein
MRRTVDERFGAVTTIRMMTTMMTMTTTHWTVHKSMTTAMVAILVSSNWSDDHTMLCHHVVTGTCMYIDVGAGSGARAAGTSSGDDVAQVIKWFWGRPLPRCSYLCTTRLQASRVHA